MKSKYWYCFTLLSAIALYLTACDKDDPVMPDCGQSLVIDWATLGYNPTPYVLETLPSLPKSMPIPPDNPLTVEGIALGRKLFYDPILSNDSTQSCGSCHAQLFGFTDNGKQFSTGIDNIAGNRNAMAVINLGYGLQFFWDGRSPSLEHQALGPVENPIEMHETWPDAVCKLMRLPDYRRDFYRAFGVQTITPAEVTKAIAQFERTMVSGSSRFDLALQPGSGVFLTDDELAGYQAFFTETADCFHCHTGVDGAYLFGDNLSHNNGLDSVTNINGFADKGRGGVTNNPNDNGKFKTPTLRNIALTAPYMHDGRFGTLEEVLDHYSHGIKPSPTLSPIIATKFGTGKQFSPELKQQLLAFLNALTDTAFVQNPAFAAP